MVFLYHYQTRQARNGDRTVPGVWVLLHGDRSHMHGVLISLSDAGGENGDRTVPGVRVVIYGDRSYLHGVLISLSDKRGENGDRAVPGVRVMLHVTITTNTFIS